TAPRTARLSPPCSTMASSTATPCWPGSMPWPLLTAYAKGCTSGSSATFEGASLYNPLTMDANPPDGDGCEARLHPISLNTAAALTGRSVRTWQRRIEDGQAPRLGDGRGRSLVPFEAVRPWLAVPLSEEDVQVLVRADQ